MRTAHALILIGALGAGCGGDSKPTVAPETAAEQAAPAEPAPDAAALKEKKPDPEALGVEGTLPADVPVPQGAKALYPPMVASGTTRASFEVGGPLAEVQAFYKAQLAAGGWSVDAEKQLDAQSLLSAKKDGRELSVAMSEVDGRTQLVLLLVGG